MTLEEKIEQLHEENRLHQSTLEELNNKLDVLLAPYKQSESLIKKLQEEKNE